MYWWVGQLLKLVNLLESLQRPSRVDAPQDPLLSPLTDLGNDIIGYQEAVPSTDGADGEVVIVGEIIGQDALHLSGAQDVTLENEGMATGTQEPHIIHH
ncbi:hypothetical protein EMCRGX_G016022 [Ephydatia muelleri]